MWLGDSLQLFHFYNNVRGDVFQGALNLNKFNISAPATYWMVDAMNLNEAAKRKEIFLKKFPKCEAKGMVTL